MDDAAVEADVGSGRGEGLGLVGTLRAGDALSSSSASLLPVAASDGRDNSFEGTDGGAADDEESRTAAVHEPLWTMSRPSFPLISCRRRLV